MNPHVAFHKILYAMRLLKTFYLVKHADRSREADYSRVAQVDIAGRKEQQIADAFRAVPPLPQDQWFEQSLHANDWIGQLNPRGCDLEVLYFQISGGYLSCDEEYCPRSEYGDRFASKTLAASIHSLDDESTTDFICPDISHLGQRDSPEFTEMRLDLLARKNLLP